MTEHIIICGLGHIGFRSFELFNQLDIKVTVITDKTPLDWQKKVEASGSVVIIGDARSDELLVQAGIESASAILAVTDQDLVNVSVVMDARRLNPKIKIICRLFDTNLGKHISEAFGVSQVLSTSEVAAPIFCDSIEDGLSTAQFRFNGQLLTLTEKINSNQESLLSVGPDGKVSYQSSENGSLHLIVALGVEKDLKQTLLFGLKDWLFRPVLMRFHRVLGVIASAIFVAMAVIKYQMSLSWINSLYFVTATITTVGYGDFNFSTASPEMKIFGICLMLIGATSLAVLFSVVADTLLSERLSSLLGGHLVPQKDHIILVGGGHIGIRIAEQLTNNRSTIVVIENDRVGRVPADIKRKVAVVEGDARTVDTLNKANVSTAKAILMVSDDDVGNLSVGLAAHSLNSEIKTIARIFDADLGDKLQKKLAIKKIFSVSGIAAPYFVSAAIAEKVVAAIRWQNHLIILSENHNLHGAMGSDVKGLNKPLYLAAIPLFK